jgi:hypothetical protein
MSTIEFFRPESQRPLDSEGYELPPWLNPFFAIPEPDPCEECEEAGDDEQDPADWPTSQEIDGDRWEPTEADIEWLNTSPANVDPAGYAEWSRRLEELHQASEFMDRFEAIYGPRGITDHDVAAGGLPIG